MEWQTTNKTQTY